MGSVEGKTTKENQKPLISSKNKMGMKDIMNSAVEIKSGK
jgi:hypothetical protein